MLLDKTSMCVCTCERASECVWEKNQRGKMKNKKHQNVMHRHFASGGNSLSFSDTLERLRSLHIRGDEFEMKRALSSSSINPTAPKRDTTSGNAIEKWNPSTAQEADLETAKKLLTQQENDYENKFSKGIGTYNRGIRDPRSKLSGQELVEFWVGVYRIDRKRRSEAKKMSNPLEDFFYDDLRPDTPLRTRASGSQSSQQGEEGDKEGDKEDTGLLTDEEYANFRRGYEASLVRYVNVVRKNTKLSRPKGPVSQFTLHPSGMVDKLRPGKRWENTRIPEDLEAQPDYYHVVFPNQLYILRVDQPENYPTQEEIELDNQKYELEMRESAAEDGESGDEGADGSEGDEGDDEMYDDALDDALELETGADSDLNSSEEARERQRIEYLGEPQVGLVLNDSHLVLPLQSNHAESLYTSIAILMHERGDAKTAADLRKAAIDWLSKPDPAPGSRQLELINSPTSTFRSYLNGLIPAGTPGRQRDFTFGMPRTMRMINAYRRTMPQYSNSDFKSWTTSAYDTTPGFESESLLTQYANFQRKTRSWPTMYDVEALAHALNIDIHLYYTSGDRYDSWKKIVNPLRFGPFVNQPSARTPLKLLWSGDHQMHFRPLISKGIDQSSPAFRQAESTRNDYERSQVSTVSADLPFTRDDRDGTALEPNYYARIPWNGEYDN